MLENVPEWLLWYLGMGTLLAMVSCKASPHAAARKASVFILIAMLWLPMSIVLLLKGSEK